MPTAARWPEPAGTMHERSAHAVDRRWQTLGDVALIGCERQPLPADDGDDALARLCATLPPTDRRRCSTGSPRMRWPGALAGCRRCRPRSSRLRTTRMRCRRLPPLLLASCSPARTNCCPSGCGSRRSRRVRAAGNPAAAARSCGARQPAARRGRRDQRSARGSGSPRRIGLALADAHGAPGGRRTGRRAPVAGRFRLSSGWSGCVPAAVSAGRCTACASSPTGDRKAEHRRRLLEALSENPPADEGLPAVFAR